MDLGKHVNSKTTIVTLALALTLATDPASMSGQPYGLETRAPVGAFLNGTMPATQPAPGSFDVVKAFPNLVFFDPTFLVPEPGTNRLYVGLRQGEIWFIPNDPNTTNRSLFLDLTATTQGWDASGLLGMAFHPEFGQPGSTNRGFVYVYRNYSASPQILLEGRLPPTTPSFNRLSRFTVPDGSLVADPNSEVVLINQYDHHLYHNGGGIFFGADGFLYLSIGDEGGANDEYGSTQKLNAGLFSGVFRIDVNMDPTKSHPIRRQPISSGVGSPPSYSSNYFVPNDNPFLDPGGSLLEEYWALGLRSPHRMTFDPISGQIWLGDVGEHTVEEVDLIERGGNYQWTYKEGDFDGPQAMPSPLIGTNKPPVYDYIHADNNNCVIGGYVYRGTRFPELHGKYIFGDNGSGRIWTLTYNGSNAPSVAQIANMPPAVNLTGLGSFGLDQNNELYMCQVGTNGYIWKLEPQNPNTQPPPPLLSQTHAFTNLATLATASGLVPFDVNAPLWSDGAHKWRWAAIPNDGVPYGTNEQISFSTNGEWSFPPGSVFVKHFELSTDENNPSLRKRLETRFIVTDTNGSVYGLTYKWRDDNSDADLLTNGLTEDIAITTTTGTRTQAWYYPSRQDCLICHNSNAKFILGPKTRQLNGNYTYPGTGVTDNQLRTWNHLGMFDPPLDENIITNLAATVDVSNTAAPLVDRVRSYIDANCAHCHRPNGVQAYFDARFDTPLTNQAIINGIVENNLGITGAKIVVAANTAKSTMYLRASAVGANQMPPLAKNVVDTNAVAVLAAWINSLPPTPDLPAPWQHKDIGNVGLPGDADFNNNRFTAIGSGADIYSVSDAFHFIYRAVTGDVQIIARVKSLQYTDPWAKAGVMVRENLEDYSGNTFMAMTPGNGANLQFRLNNYDSSLNIGGVTNSAPYWVKLVRTGGVFKGYSSPDGMDWSLAGTITNSIPVTSYVGLAVCAHNNSALNTASFDYVSVETAPLPSLDFIADAIVDEGTTLTVTNLSAQPGEPTNSLTFHLLNPAPSGMSINTTNGVIQWTPSEAQGPGIYPVTAYVMENNNIALIAARAFTVTVNEVNQAPLLGSITNRQVSLGNSLSVQLGATDADLPPNTLAFVLGTNAPDGMALNTSSATLIWTPSTAQTPSTNLITVSVHDDGTPSLSTTQTFEVVVNEPTGSTNLPPPWLAGDVGTVGVPGHSVYDAGSFTAAGSGVDVFGNADAFHFIHRNATGDVQIIARVVGLQPTDPWAKAGVMMRRTLDDFSANVFMAVTPGNGVNCQFRQDDYGSSANSSGPASSAPVWLKLVRNGYDFYGFASDNGTNWSLVHVSSNQMPAVIQVGLAVSSHDNAVLNSAVFDNVEVSLIGANTPPTLAPVSDQTILKGVTLSLTNAATDPDLPPDTLAFSLGEGAPAGLLLNATNGVLTWTPGGDQGGTTNLISIIVTDAGVPPLSATQQFNIVVINTNLAPTLGAIANRIVAQGATLLITNIASDPDVPSDTLTFGLESNAPPGMSIDATNGVLSWTPTSEQAPGSNYVTVTVTDGGLPPLSASSSFTVLVLLSNPPPAELPAPWQHLDIGETGLPGNADYNTGVFTAIGAGADVYNNYDAFHFIHREVTGDVQIVARVASLQNTDPWAKAGVMIRRTTNDFSSHVFMTLTPGNGLNYQHRQDDYGGSVNTAGPVGAAPRWVTLIRSGNDFTGYASTNGTDWEFVGSSSNNMPATVQVGLAVTAHNAAALNTATFDNVQVILPSTNRPPTISPIPDLTVHAGATLAFTAPANDPDLPNDLLSFSLLAGTGLGATLNPTNGQFNWQPDLSHANTTNTFTIAVTDSGVPSLGATQLFNVAVGPPLTIQSIEVSNEWVTLNWTALPGANYQVQWNAELETAAWSNLAGPVTATGPTASQQDLLGPVPRYYRVVQLP